MELISNDGKHKVVFDYGYQIISKKLLGETFGPDGPKCHCGSQLEISNFDELPDIVEIGNDFDFFDDLPDDSKVNMMGFRTDEDDILDSLDEFEVEMEI